MAGLHNSFSSVPPIIRTRGKELLDAIRDCVKRTSAPSTRVVEGLFERGVEKKLGIVSSVDSANVHVMKERISNIFAPMSGCKLLSLSKVC